MPADYLVLGDSYSIGEGVEHGARWPTKLAEAMRARGIAVSAPHYIATSGWTTDELSAAIDAEQSAGKLRHSYGLVSLQIGVNDQYRGRPLAEFEPQFSRLLERAIAFAGGNPRHVLALSIPDWGRTPFAHAQGRDASQVTRELDDYNAAAAASCHQHGVAWVDITGLTRAKGGGEEVVSDGLHPSPVMYARWVATVLQQFPPK
ncbi:MAG: SGNH/GDSL hydrolase family protein [Arenimonas sp.]